MISTTSSSAAEAGEPGGAGFVVCNSSPSWGGTEHYAIRIARGLRDRGHRVRFLWSHPTVGDPARAAGLECVRWPLRCDPDPVAVLSLVRHLRDIRAAAVLTTRWREYLVGGLAARLLGSALGVVSFGLSEPPRDDLKRRLLFRLADRVVVNAEEVRDALLQRSWFPADKVRVVLNGVDLDRFPVAGDPIAAAEFRRDLAVPDSAPLVVTVGALTTQKRHDRLVAVAARLVARQPDVRVVVVGEGEGRPELEAAIRTAGLVDRFLLAGFRADVRPALAAADVFALTSDNEGMAWVLMEAAAAGLPIVTTDVSGARACVEDGTSGLVVSPYRDEDFAAAVVDLLLDPDRRVRLGRHGRRLAEARFDAERMVAQTEAILLSGSPRT